MRYQEKPENFSPDFLIVNCFIEHDGKFLMLLRQDHKFQGGRWGLVGGKVDPGETLPEALAREIREETGLEIPADKLVYFDKTYHHHPECDFVYHIFSTRLEHMPEITISPGEHKEYTWCTPEEMLAMPKESIVDDSDDITKIFYKI